MQYNHRNITYGAKTQCSNTAGHSKTFKKYLNKLYYK